MTLIKLKITFKGYFFDLFYSSNRATLKYMTSFLFTGKN
jgi:hypothetical protein